MLQSPRLPLAGPSYYDSSKLQVALMSDAPLDLTTVPRGEPLVGRSRTLNVELLPASNRQGEVILRCWWQQQPQNPGSLEITQGTTNALQCAVLLTRTFSRLVVLDAFRMFFN